MTASEYPFLSLEVKRFIGDEAVDLLPLEGMGLLFRCMLRAWRQGSVPASHADLARLVGAAEEQIDALLPRLSAFYEERDGRLVFPLIEAERERVAGMLADKSRAGTVSAQKKEERKQKRLEYRRKAKERKAASAVAIGVGTGVPHTPTDINPHPQLLKATDPPHSSPSPAAGAASPERPVKIETRFDSDGRPSVSVSEPVCSQVNFPGRGNGDGAKQSPYERDVQVTFERTFLGRSWADEKASVLSVCHKHGRGAFNVLCTQLVEMRAEGKAPDNEVAYVIGAMNKGGRT